jgi:hypothetical protein
VLVSDGEFHGESLTGVLARAREKNVRIHTILCGTPEGTVLRVPAAGGAVVKRDAHGEPVHTRADPSVLQQISEATGGSAWRLPDAAPRRRAQLVRGIEWAAAGPPTGRPLDAAFVLAALLVLGFSFLLQAARQ